MNVLITGASGLIGSALAEKLRANNNSIICQSRSMHIDQPGIKWIKNDLVNDSLECLNPYKIEMVYHLAGQTSAYAAREQPIADLTANVVSTLRLLEYFRLRGEKPFFVLAGTATEVGLVEQHPISETTPDNPITFYDLSKLTAERYLFQYVREGLITGCGLRLSNVYGGGHGKTNDRGILDRVFSKGSKDEIVTIYGDGNLLRDYIYIEDVLSALTACINNKSNLNGNFYYIGTGRGVLLKDAFMKVAQLGAQNAGRKAQFKHIEPPVDLSPIEFRSAVIDATKFTTDTGWKPKYDFESGILDAYR